MAKRKRKEEVAPAPDRLDMAEWPVVPAAAQPREVVFDTLTQDDLVMLRRRGYAPVLLRILPRKTELDDQRWREYFLLGVAEGTVMLTKEREEGLYYDLKAHGHLDRRQLTGRTQNQEQKASLESLLNWGGSRHAFKGNTTIVSPEKVAAFVQAAEEHALQEEQKKALDEEPLPLDPEDN